MPSAPTRKKTAPSATTTAPHTPPTHAMPTPISAIPTIMRSSRPAALCMNPTNPSIRNSPFFAPGCGVPRLSRRARHPCRRQRQLDEQRHLALLRPLHERRHACDLFHHRLEIFQLDVPEV